MSFCTYGASTRHVAVEQYNNIERVTRIRSWSQTVMIMCHAGDGLVEPMFL